jgi:hypothetical protein
MDTEPRETRDLVADQVRRFRTGDRAAAEPLARRALRLSLRTGSALMRSREDAADVAQEVAADVLGSLGKLRDPEARYLTASNDLSMLRAGMAAAREAVKEPRDVEQP